MKENIKAPILIFIIFIISLHCSNKSGSSGIRDTFASDSISKDNTLNLSDLQRKILNGAKQNLSEGAEYDISMAYYVLKFKDGNFTGQKVYPDGDIDPSTGVCTDVIIRSLRNAGIVDLQKAVQEDLILKRNDYPLSRWGNKKPDANIDHRRVMNLEVWFSGHWNTQDGNNFMPGDIVVWDMNEDGASDHIGIVSDKTENERYFVIHNHPDPGHIAEEDKLYKWKISGHYMVRE